MLNTFEDLDLAGALFEVQELTKKWSKQFRNMPTNYAYDRLCLYSDIVINLKWLILKGEK